VYHPSTTTQQEEKLLQKSSK